MHIAIVTLSLTTCFFFTTSMAGAYEIGKRNRRIVELRKLYNALAKEQNEYADFINRLQSNDFEIDDDAFEKWTDERNKRQDIINDRMTSL